MIVDEELQNVEVGSESGRYLRRRIHHKFPVNQRDAETCSTVASRSNIDSQLENCRP